ncbi:hypothetical protein J437_LFUL017003 [Ladona fulva]|uniref:NADH-ubiquinone oxidoreductase chain 5 n=1 Tax=Ladona fulva TaxID=123851 RepID=A0A8K0P8K1_LADFU|nr:hypothetical protein J437_LFUL017003 [Ladona fulva]
MEAPSPVSSLVHSSALVTARVYLMILLIGFVLFISRIVIFYSYDYMEGDPFISRFILLPRYGKSSADSMTR